MVVFPDIFRNSFEATLMAISEKSNWLKTSSMICLLQPF